MATAWALPAADIITDALQILGQIGAGQTASDEDHSLCMTALQNIIKELPLHGVSWPKMTVTPVALAWSAGTPAKVTMPVDYYGVPVVSYVANAVNIDIEIITKAVYDAIQQPDYVALYPQKLYIAPNNTGFLWPVPSSDPSLKLTYQAIALDAAVAAMPDVAQTWIAGLGLWVANEVAPKFGIDMASRADIERRFLGRRRLMLAYAAESAPIRFMVAD